MKTKQLFWTLVASVAALSMALTGCEKDQDGDAGKLTLNKASYEMYVGEDYTLKATVDGAAVEATWTTSDANIATVEAGKVVAIAEGSATITATYADQTATCAFTILAAEAEEAPVIDAPGAGFTTLVVYIPNSACEESKPFVIGSLPGDGKWSNTLAMTRCEGKKEWWQVTVEALNAENATNFKFRMDDGNNGWTYEPKETYNLSDETLEYLAVKADEDKNLLAIANCDGKTLYVNCGKWATPCIETNKAGKASFTVSTPEVPEGYTVGIIGKFEEDGEGATKFWNLSTGVLPLTKGEGNVYTLNDVDVPAACEFKVLLSADGTTWSWDLGQESNDNFVMPLDLNAQIEVTAWKGLPSAE